MLNTSLDDLLNNDELTQTLTTRENYELELALGQTKKVKKDYWICKKFPDDEIYNLMAVPKLSKSEKLIDNAIGFLGIALLLFPMQSKA